MNKHIMTKIASTRHPILSYVIRTIIRLTLLLLCVSLVSFILMEVSPIDPIRAYISAADVVSVEQRQHIEAHFGLNKPPIERFTLWFSNVLQFDLGISLIYREPVIQVIAQRFLGSLTLMLSSWIISGLIGISLGIIMGLQSDTKLDKILKSLCLTLSAIPTFLLAMLFLFIFSVVLKWFPVGFSAPIGVLESEITFLDRVHHLLLPTLTLSIASFAQIALHAREKLIEVLKSDFVLLSKTRGFSKWRIVAHHGVRNILTPVLTIQFAQLSEIFGGSVLAETVFSYPGLGSTVVNAGLRGDVPLLLGITLFSAVFVFCGNLTANLLYPLIDPKLRCVGRAKRHRGKAL